MATVLQHQLLGKEIVRRADAAGATTHVTATASGDTQPKTTIASQPDFPRTLQIATAGGWTSSDAVQVTITGTDVRGAAITETLAVPASGTTMAGQKPFATVTSVSWATPAGWTAGTFSVAGGPALGITVPSRNSGLAVTKETAYDDSAVPPNPANSAIGTVDSANQTYVPTAALNSATVVEIFYLYTIDHVLQP